MTTLENKQVLFGSYFGAIGHLGTYGFTFRFEITNTTYVFDVLDKRLSTNIVAPQSMQAKESREPRHKTNERPNALYHASHICAPTETRRLNNSSRNAMAVSCFRSPALSMTRSPSAISRDVAHPTTSLLFQPSPPTFLISCYCCISLYLSTCTGMLMELTIISAIAMEKTGSMSSFSVVQLNAGVVAVAVIYACPF